MVKQDKNSNKPTVLKTLSKWLIQKTDLIKHILKKPLQYSNFKLQNWKIQTKQKFYDDAGLLLWSVPEKTYKLKEKKHEAGQLFEAINACTNHMNEHIFKKESLLSSEPLLSNATTLSC